MIRNVNFLRLAFDKKTWPITVAFLLLLAALCMPKILLPHDTYRYMVTFDVTQSMDTQDVQWESKSVSRLTLARHGAREVLRDLPCGSKIGWGIFADYRVLPLLLPLEVCGHYEELLASLEQIDGNIRWANASNIGKGVTWSLRTAKQIAPDTNVIFFTDGHESPPLRNDQPPPMQGITPKEIGGKIIGVGGDFAVPIPKTDSSGKQVGFWRADEVVQGSQNGPALEHLSRLNDEHLKSLAHVTGLSYARLTDQHSLTNKMLDKTLAIRQPALTDMRWIPASLGLLFFVWRFRPDLLRRRRTGELVRSF